MTPGATAWPPPSKRRGKWSSSGILVVREAETGGSRARRRREECWPLATTWLMGALTCRPAAVRVGGVRRPPSRPRRACGGLLAPPGARDGPQKGCPQRPSLLALGSASFGYASGNWTAASTPGAARHVGPTQASVKTEFREGPKSRLGVKSSAGGGWESVHREQATEARRIVRCSCVRSARGEPSLKPWPAAAARAAPRLARRAADLRERRLSGRRPRNEHLPNGVVVTTTAPGAPLTCVGVGVGSGASHGPRSAALAASCSTASRRRTAART